MIRCPLFGGQQITGCVSLAPWIWGICMAPTISPDMLHVVVAYANPLRWQNRLARQLEIEKHMVASGVQLTTGECAYGERPLELVGNDAINRVQVRAKTMVWNKENLINIGISSIPEA